MGFTESVRRRTGVEVLWGMLREFASEDVTVLMPWEWKDDMRSLAEFIARNSHEDPEVLVCAYSWGAGYAFPRFAREAAALQILIRTACLCDPVYRSRWLPWWLPDPSALLRHRRIVIPAGVERVRCVRQDIDWPLRGHDLVAEDARTTILPPEMVCATHDRIDDSLAFRGMVLAEVRRFLGREGGGAERHGRDAHAPCPEGSGFPSSHIPSPISLADCKEAIL